jgi:hypothetical protein
MREVARRRCADLIGQGRVRLEPRDAAGTGEPDASGDVVLAVNDVIWPGRSAGFAELHRVLRPRRPHAAVRAPEMLRIEVAALATEIVEAGFTGIEPGPGNHRAAPPAPPSSYALNDQRHSLL